VPESLPSFFTRLSLAFSTFFRLLFDAAYAARVRPLLPGSVPRVDLEAPAGEAPTNQASALTERDVGPALQLLAMLQREGRLIDFVQQEITTYSDADIGAAARVVHQGCRKAFLRTLVIETIRSEPEGSGVSLPSGFDAKAHRLVGAVQGQPPYQGTLRHRGWRIRQVTLEEPLASADLGIVAPAEVEL
jgi:hypothetical protein